MTTTASARATARARACRSTSPSTAASSSTRRTPTAASGRARTATGSRASRTARRALRRPCAAGGRHAVRHEGAPALDCLKEESNIDLNGPYAIRDAGDAPSRRSRRTCAARCGARRLPREPRGGAGGLREALLRHVRLCRAHGRRGGRRLLCDAQRVHAGSADDDFNFGFPKIEAYVFDGSMDIVEGTSVVPTTCDYLGYGGIADGGCTVPDFPKDLPKPWSNLGGHGPDAPLVDVEGRQELRFYGVGPSRARRSIWSSRCPTGRQLRRGRQVDVLRSRRPERQRHFLVRRPRQPRPGLGQISLPPSVWKYGKGSSITSTAVLGRAHIRAA